MKNNWPVKKLGEVTDVFSGVWGPQDNAGTAVLRSTNFNNNGTIAWNEVAYRSIPENKVNQLALHQGDILVEKSGGSPAQPVGRVVYFDAEQQGKVVFGNFISKLQVNDKEIEPKFLFYYLLYFYKTGGINRYQSQTTGIRNLQLKDYLGIEIPKFRTEVQKKIVERLDAIRKAQELCDQQIQKTEELFESTLIDEFNKLKDAKNLVEVTDILMGQSPPSNTYNLSGNGLPFFQGKTEFEDIYPRIVKYCSVPQRVANKDDILLSVRAPVGPVNLAPQECCIGRGVASLRAKEGFEQMFVFFFMKLNEKKLALKGFGSTFSAINRVDIERIKIPITSVSEQQKIVKKLEAVQNYKKLLLKQKSFLKELFDSVLDKSMKGF